MHLIYWLNLLSLMCSSSESCHCRSILSLQVNTVIAGQSCRCRSILLLQVNPVFTGQFWCYRSILSMQVNPVVTGQFWCYRSIGQSCHCKSILSFARHTFSIFSRILCDFSFRLFCLVISRFSTIFIYHWRLLQFIIAHVTLCFVSSFSLNLETQHKCHNFFFLLNK